MTIISFKDNLPALDLWMEMYMLALAQMVSVVDKVYIAKDVLFGRWRDPVSVLWVSAHIDVAS